MDFAQSVFGFFVAIIILVTVHEFGHFYVARLCGVRVLRFCVGLGSPICSWYDKQGTEYSIAPFPLGGYVKMLGEDDDNIPAGDEQRTLESKTLLQRIAILAAGPFANFVLAIIIFTGLFMSGTTELAPVIGKVIPDSEASFAGLEVGQEIIAVDGVPTPSREVVLERMMLRLGETGHMTMTVKYPGDSNLDYGVQLVLNEWLRDTQEPNPFEGIGISFYRPSPLTTISMVMDDSPAKRAGLLAGDKIVKADQLEMTSWDAWVEYVRARAGQEILIGLERGSDYLELTITPEPIKVAEGQTIGRVGVSPTFEPWPEDMLRQVSYSPLAALLKAIEKNWTTSVSILISVKKLIVTEISMKNLSGPIGIATVAGDFVRAGAEHYIRFLAILSIYLGVFNLLPIPILDGGRILYYLIEGVKGSPLSERVKLAGLQLGLGMLAVVMVLAFYNDILRLIVPKT